MKNINWSGAMRSLALVAAAACAVPSAVASDRLDGLFSKIEPSLRERAFMRLNYIHVNVKTTSGEAYDVTGPVVGINDIYQYLGTGSGYTSMFGVPQASYNLFSAALTGRFNSTITVPDSAIERDAVFCPQLAVGLGTPCGVKAKSDSTVGTPAISVGYFLDESMNWAIEAFLLAAPIKAEVYGDGRNVRDWLFVKDHCAAIRRVLEAGRIGETYNVGGDAERQNIDVVKAICALLDQRRPRADGQPRESQITFVKDRPGHDRRYAIDAAKLKGELGWAPTVSFEQGLAATVDWYLDNPGWVARVLDGSYRLERIGTEA